MDTVPVLMLTVQEQQIHKLSSSTLKLMRKIDVMSGTQGTEPHRCNQWYLILIINIIVSVCVC